MKNNENRRPDLRRRTCDGRAGARDAVGTGRLWAAAGVLLGLAVAPASAPAFSEEILGTDPATPGHFQVEQRFGYFTTFNPPAPAPKGANLRAVAVETEIGYGVNDWYEIAITTPYAFARGNASAMPGSAALPGYGLQTGGVTFCQTFMQPDREERNLFFGLVVRGIYAPPGALPSDLFVPRSSIPILANAPGPRFVQEASPRFAGQFTPIVGMRFGDDYEAIFNANMTVGFDRPGSAFEPSLRVVKQVTDNWKIGFEHFANLGPIGHVVPWNQQSQVLYAVADTKFKEFELSFGAGYGLTEASRGPALKMSIGRDF